MPVNVSLLKFKKDCTSSIDIPVIFLKKLAFRYKRTLKVRTQQAVVNVPGVRPQLTKGPTTALPFYRVKRVV